MKLDILAIAAHPDDAELSCVGTLLMAKKQGKKIGIVDLTQGELGTNGTAETRKVEAAEAAKIIGLDARENLAMPDGFFQNSKENQIKIIEQIRKYQPDVVLINAISDRHPDHGKGATIAKEACFLAGLSKIETTVAGANQDKWRPKAVYHYIQDYYMKPDFIIDISEVVDQKIETIKAFKTQFFDPSNPNVKTPISGENFFDFLKGRWADYGRYIGAEYGEGFVLTRPAGVKDITDLI
ncbi:MAG: bacillithiol biosynthesis deacetylase BshB1 [Crocinitomix sp. MedPE-SWsnd]|nr:MAG: bacillithiol biosynthesis deacetylase BshB1 [Crocinitomix sp. MedPE-SWsnd]